MLTEALNGGRVMAMRMGLLALAVAGLLPAGCALTDDWPFGKDKTQLAAAEPAGETSVSAPAVGEPDAAMTEIGLGGEPVHAPQLQAEAAPMHHQVGGDPLADEIEALVQTVMDAPEPAPAASSLAASDAGRAQRRAPAVPRLTPADITNATPAEDRLAAKKSLPAAAPDNAPKVSNEDLKELHDELFPKPLWRSELEARRQNDPPSHPLPRGN